MDLNFVFDAGQYVFAVFINPGWVKPYMLSLDFH